MTDWRTRAACLTTDPDLFYPHLCQDRVAHEAKRICDSCPVTAECLAHALSLEGDASADCRHGIWGGTTPHERAGVDSSPRKTEARCGTDGGYYRHRRTLHEEACEACKLAHRAYEAKRSQAADNPVDNSSGVGA